MVWSQMHHIFKSSLQHPLSDQQTSYSGQIPEFSDSEEKKWKKKIKYQDFGSALNVSNLLPMFTYLDK